MDTQNYATARFISLLDKATQKAGNEAKLGKLVLATRHNVNAWKHGIRPCPLEAQVLMASIAGLDVETVMREALLERNAGTARGEKLEAVLKKGAAVAGAVTASALCGSSALAANLPGVLRCIFWFL